MISPQIAIPNSAPPDRRTSLEGFLHDLPVRPHGEVIDEHAPEFVVVRRGTMPSVPLGKTTLVNPLNRKGTPVNDNGCIY